MSRAASTADLLVLASDARSGDTAASRPGLAFGRQMPSRSVGETLDGPGKSYDVGRQPKPTAVSRSIWAYAYEMDPPQPESRLSAIRDFLDRAHADAKQGARTWEGRFVVEQQITHILIVSDDPGQDGEVNRNLEAGLRDLEAGFSRTAPLAVVEDSTPPEVEGS